MQDALEGVTGVEFGSFAAGPGIGKYLANFGARVIHVESAQRPDGLRTHYPPFKDDKVGLNRAGAFAFWNDSKYGVTLNLKHPQGLELAHRLVEKSDFVIENMRPGVMARLGFGYRQLRERNPRLVLLSTSNMGQTGPYADHPGFGSQLSSLSGFSELIGRADGPPLFIYGPFIDLIAVAFGGIAVLAALDHQRRTGEGAHIDLSQYEAGLQFVTAPLLEYAANGKVARRNGNRDPVAIPHGCYPCREGCWCVISCWDEEEWQRFCIAAGLPALSKDPRFSEVSERRAHETELNDLISQWTREEDAEKLMHRLQASRIHAAAVRSMRELFSDPQIASRHVWQKQGHPEMGEHHYRMGSFQLAEAPGRVRKPAPCLGEHNEEIFCGWLGLAPERYRELEGQGVFS